MKADAKPVACPDCRSISMRRRKRDTFKLILASFRGKWPYRCDACGSEFFLGRRYLRNRG